jgi:hypothetical protein
MDMTINMLLGYAETDTDNDIDADMDRDAVIVSGMPTTHHVHKNYTSSILRYTTMDQA